MKKLYKLKTIIEKVHYYNEDNHWGALCVRNTLENDKIFNGRTLNVVGNFEPVTPGCEVTITGYLVEHKTFGYQLEINSLHMSNKVYGKENIIRFLKDSSIKGISTQNAIKLYDKFGESAVHVVLHETHKIKDCIGIGEETYKQVVSSIQRYLDMEDLINFGLTYSIPIQSLYSLYNKYEKNTLKILRSNIYRVINDIDEFSFNMIDEIALKIGFKKDDPKRLRAALIYCIIYSVKLTGSTGTEINCLKKTFFKTIGLFEPTLFSVALNILRSEDLIRIKGNVLYWKYYLEKEIFSAKIIKGLINIPIYQKVSEKIITENIKKFPFTLTSEQENILKDVLNHRFSIITGGPGTGKTTIMKGIVDILKDSKIPFYLLSPTGKATKRILECTKVPASTIHRYFDRAWRLDTASTPILASDSVIIIDESSMLDIIMLAKILDIAKYSSIRIILVGDYNQLESVQVGNVLSDVINSGVVKVFQLNVIKRQTKGSNIVKYCSDINIGNSIKPCNLEDLVYTNFYDENDLLEELITNFKKEVKIHGLKNVQVITPYKKGALGMNNINSLLSSTNQNIRCPWGYAKGDKVMQLKNNYTRNVFNGDCGIVSDIVVDEFSNKVQVVRVEYDMEKDSIDSKNYWKDDTISYTKETISEITLAYSITCHKAQGAEFPVVFVILDDSNGDFLLTKKMLYTALSRGKEKVYLYAMPGCVNKCIKNTKETVRTTQLKDLLKSF